MCIRCDEHRMFVCASEQIQYYSLESKRTYVKTIGHGERRKRHDLRIRSDFQLVYKG